MAAKAAKTDKPQKPVSTRRRKLKRALMGVGIAAPVLGLLLWIGIHRIPWLGPLLADSLRAVIGVDAVAKLEDFAYGVQDRWNRFAKKDEKPKAYWDVPKDEPEPQLADAGPDGAVALPPFRPKDVGPVHDNWSAPGDGQWVAIRDVRRPKEQPYMYKTLLHPDRNRSWAELFVVAVDLRRSELYAVAGYQEPKSFEKEAKDYKRPAKIPQEHQEELLAAFNGGFKTEHGYYGMKVDGITLVKPRDKACTLAMFKDDSLRIATWSEIKDKEPELRWYRQAPGCMYENDKMHIGLRDPNNRAWGATLDGETVIRRSSVGLNAARDILYVGITNNTTARALGDGMHHAGATDIAQLDVNWSFPKFVLFEPVEGGAERKAVPLAKGFEFGEDEYIRERSMRDFFYLVRKDPRTAQK